MKTKILSLILIIIASCSKQDDPIKPDPYAKLPPETQTGANTFGCIINDQVFYPRDGTSYLFQPGGRGFIFWGSPGTDRIWDEIEIRNLQDSKPCSRMIIHLQGLYQKKVGEYIWHPSNFQNNIDGLMQNYVFAQIYDNASNSWKYYSSYENSGKLRITHYTDNNILVSGNFSGKLRLNNGIEEIEIKNGRFDLNGSTLSQKLFP
jgi:hypothetical protein